MGGLLNHRRKSIRAGRGKSLVAEAKHKALQDSFITLYITAAV